MKIRIAMAALLVAVTLAPAQAMAAEGAGANGSWLRLLLFVINFSIFAVVLVYYGGPMVRKFFGDRSAEIRGTLTRAGAAFDRAHGLADTAGGRLGRLEAEKSRLRADLDAETRHQVRSIREMAEQTAERIKRDAELTSAALADRARRGMRNQVAGAAAEVARGLIVRHFVDADQRRLLRDFMERLGEEARV